CVQTPHHFRRIRSHRRPSGEASVELLLNHRHQDRGRKPLAGDITERDPDAVLVMGEVEVAGEGARRAGDGVKLHAGRRRPRSLPRPPRPPPPPAASGWHRRQGRNPFSTASRAPGSGTRFSSRMRRASRQVGKQAIRVVRDPMNRTCRRARSSIPSTSTPSRRRSSCFIALPNAYSPIPPVAGTTRWQGTTKGRRVPGPPLATAPPPPGPP